MAKITWLGEDDLYPNGRGPLKNEWNGVTFPKGEAIDVSNPHMISKAKTNRFYTVEDDAKEEPKRGPGRPSNAEKAAQAAATDPGALTPSVQAGKVG